jgi:predicted O-methyltransferase YrrM
MPFDFKLIEHIPKGHAVSDNLVVELYRRAYFTIGNVIEIGSFFGRSTAAIALGLKDNNGGVVYAIDPHDTRVSDYSQFLENIKLLECDKHINVIRNYSQNVYNSSKRYEIVKDTVGMLFIDGEHTYNAVKRDLLWGDYVRKGGVIALHDYSKKYAGIRQAVNEFVETHKVERINFLDTMIVFKKDYE